MGIHSHCFAVFLQQKNEGGKKKHMMIEKVKKTQAHQKFNPIPFEVSSSSALLQ